MRKNFGNGIEFDVDEIFIILTFQFSLILHILQESAELNKHEYKNFLIFKNMFYNIIIKTEWILVNQLLHLSQLSQ